MPRPPPAEELPWKVVGVKIDGANPGFRIETSAGKVHVIKFDAVQQWGRASTGDVVSSRLYHAAGFHVPCNRVVHVDTDKLELPAQEIKDPGGKTLTKERILELMAHLPRQKDGTVRAMASEFLSGKPIGPWDYSGTRGDDPNDVVDHEDRRELRGSRILGAWVNHHDSAARTPHDTSCADGSARRVVRHHLLDFGSTLGSGSTQAQSRRAGNELHLGITGRRCITMLTLGLYVRPWIKVRVSGLARRSARFEAALFRAGEVEAGIPQPGVPQRAAGRPILGRAHRRGIAMTTRSAAVVQARADFSDPRATGVSGRDSLLARKTQGARRPG